jgi:hypothetical protein
MATSASNEQPKPPPETSEIARLILTISGIGIIVIAGVALAGAGFSGAAQFKDTSQLVFNSLLPLLGTWVGTVLAYYFSRKNFESASQSVERMVTLTTDQKLGQLFVQKEMLRPGEITVYSIPNGQGPKDVLLKDLRGKLGGKITRIPVVDSKGVVLYIIHQSGLFKFIAEKAVAGGTAIDKLTMQDLVDDAELHNWVTNIVYISEGASVADAKAKMDEQKGCQDLIVTKSGSKSEPMLGWMTNVDIGRLSKA